MSGKEPEIVAEMQKVRRLLPQYPHIWSEIEMGLVDTKFGDTLKIAKRFKNGVLVHIQNGTMINYVIPPTNNYLDDNSGSDSSETDDHSDQEEEEEDTYYVYHVKPHSGSDRLYNLVIYGEILCSFLTFGQADQYARQYREFQISSGINEDSIEIYHRYQPTKVRLARHIPMKEDGRWEITKYSHLY